jgi:hypothetical protein
MKGIKHEDNNARSNTLTVHSPKIVKTNGFLKQECKILQISCVLHHPFERVFED